MVDFVLTVKAQEKACCNLLVLTKMNDNAILFRLFCLLTDEQNEQDTCHKWYIVHVMNLAGNLILVSINLLCLDAFRA